MTFDQIKTVDPKGMYQWIKEFPQQVETAVEIGKAARVKINTHKVRNIVLTGLGGSAIGGDLLRSYLADDPECGGHTVWLSQYRGSSQPNAG